MPGCAPAQSLSTVLQSAEHPSAAFVLPSSQASPSPGSILPLPHPTAHGAASAQTGPASSFEPPPPSRSGMMMLVPPPPLVGSPPAPPPVPALVVAPPLPAVSVAPPVFALPLSVPQLDCESTTSAAVSVAKIRLRCMDHFLLRGVRDMDRAAALWLKREARGRRSTIVVRGRASRCTWKTCGSNTCAPVRACVCQLVPTTIPRRAID